MFIIICVLLGIVAEVIKANAWFIIPNYISWICFGLAGAGCLFKVVSYFNVKRKLKKMNDDINKFFD